MKTTKILLGFILGFLFFIHLKAQTTPIDKKAIDSYMRATYIFEGKTDSSKYFTIKTGEYTYVNFMAYFIEVDKVIKGNMQKGTIEIFDWASGITYKGPDGVRNAQRGADNGGGIIGHGLYFCWDKSSDMTTSCFINSNAKILRYYDGVEATNGIVKKIPHDSFSQYFSTLTDFYAYLSTNYGVKIEQ